TEFQTPKDQRPKTKDQRPKDCQTETTKLKKTNPAPTMSIRRVSIATFVAIRRRTVSADRTRTVTPLFTNSRKPRKKRPPATKPSPAVPSKRSATTARRSRPTAVGRSQEADG